MPRLLEKHKVEQCTKAFWPGLLISQSLCVGVVPVPHDPHATVVAGSEEKLRNDKHVFLWVDQLAPLHGLSISCHRLHDQVIV